MDRYIKQKYQETVASPTIRHDTGSTGSDDHPPPLPPKTGSRFNFRSASSIFPMSSKSKREAAAARNEAQSPSRDRSPSPPRRNKPSRIFGATIGGDGTDDSESKLAKLREMGFRDEKRNAAVLKGFSGNLEKSIETLTRLEGGISRTPEYPLPVPTSRTKTPISPAGISFDRLQEGGSTKESDNPFDMLDLPLPSPAPPQSSQSTGSLAHPQILGNNPYQQPNTSNPYGLQPSQSQYGLNQAFQNMSVSGPQQPLFPNHTGGFTTPQQQFQQQQQSMTPPVPSLPQQFYPPVIYENPSQQPQSQQPQNGYNPFMQQSQARQAPPINTNFTSNPYTHLTPLSATSQTNPFMQQQQPMSAQRYAQSEPNALAQPSYYDNGAQQQQQLSPNPFFSQQQQQMAQQSYMHQNQQQFQNQPQAQQYQPNAAPMMPQQTGRADKRSILDLYNYPQLAPMPLQQQMASGQNQSQNIQTASAPGPASAPPTGNRNPFMSINGGAPASAGGDAVGAMNQFTPSQQNLPRHVSQESVDVGGWQSGRHSPDAWASISARAVR